MISCDALVVGGGPAGSTCARVLRKAAWDVVVADRATFPRDKVCAGWLTPSVWELLELAPGEYRAAGLTMQEISGFRTGVIGGALLDTEYPNTVSYAIRRCEFDDFLLRRSGARVLERTNVTTLTRDDGHWIVNGAIRTRLVIGAGGHFCPVARHMRGGRDSCEPVVAKEAEFPLAAGSPRAQPSAPELFFCRDMEGYGWCVRKGDYLNVGIGRRESHEFGRHVEEFIAYLEERDRLAKGARLHWRGHAYLASGAGPRPLVADGMLLVGDAAGLAYPESGEGIRPAIESGRLAAEMLLTLDGRFGIGDLQPYADTLRRLYPPARRTSGTLRPTIAAVARVLLRSRLFTRRVLLDRWFLRSA